MDKTLTFTGHLEELRQRILVSLAVILVFMIFSFAHAADILIFLKLPAAGVIDKLVFFSPAEAFSTYFKIAFFAALVMAAPVLLYQLWAFLSPAFGGKTRERTALFLFLSVMAFVGGVSFGYFMLLPAAIKFLIGFSQGVLQPLISASEYIGFVTGLLFGCGLVFEMPVLSFLLSRLGILDHRLLRKYWRHAVVAIFIVAAIVTPTPDPFNMCLMAFPMLFLYEISIWVSKMSGRKALAGQGF